MIRFACPRCKSVLEQPDHVAGSKLGCPSCGQRLQVPQPAEAKTMLGAPVSSGAASSSSEAQIKTIGGREHIHWYCPQCQNQVDVPLDLSQSTVRCPHCSQRIAVPTASRGRPIPPPPPGVLEPYVTANPEPRKPPATPSTSSWPGAEPPPPPLSRYSARRAADFDDDDDDYSLDRPSGGSRYSREAAAKASVSGIVCSLIGLGLLLVTLFLWVLAAGRNQFRGESANIFLIMTFVSLGSFIMGLLGTVFSSRGLDVSNTKNRGMAVAGLVCGIIAMVVGAIFLFFFLFCGLLLSSFPH